MKKDIQLLYGIKKMLFILIILAISLSAVYFYIYKNTYYVIVRFNELGALTKNMSAYYNGFKVGKIVKIGPDKDFKHTIVRINLSHKNLNLPQNTTVRVESFPSGELYLQFWYPQSPSLRTIKSGDMLEGIATYSLEEFMLGQNISGVTDIVSIHVLRALNATEIANQEIQAFFKSSSKLIQENNKQINASMKNIEITTRNFAQMSQNLNQMSVKLKNSIDEEAFKDTATNLKDTTANISKATENFDKTVKKIDDTVIQVNETAKNLNFITSGLKETLSRRFAGMKIMFGTPINPSNSCKDCCK